MLRATNSTKRTPLLAGQERDTGAGAVISAVRFADRTDALKDQRDLIFLKRLEVGPEILCYTDRWYSYLIIRPFIELF